MAKISKYLILILILGLGLRLITLDQSFWLDEASQAQMSARAISRIWSGRTTDFHPPLFYLIAHYWMIFGHSEIWLRLPSVVFGVTNIYVIYLLVKQLRLGQKLSLGFFSVNSEVFAAFLLAVNPFHIYYSQEFRSYILICLLGTLAMLSLVKSAFKSLALVNTLMIYTHYSAIFLIFTQSIYLVVYEKEKLRKFLSSSLITLLLYLPWIPQLLRQLSSGMNIDNFLPGWHSVLSLSPLKTLPITLFKLVAGRITLVSAPLYLIYMSFVIVVVFLSFRAIRTHKHLLYTWVFMPVLLMILTSFIFPQNQPFRVIYIIPAMVIISTQACLRYPKLFTTFFLYIAFFGNLLYFTRVRLQREEWRQAITFLRQISGSDSAIVVKYNDKFPPFYWYDPDLKVTAAVPHYPASLKDVAGRLAFLSYDNQTKNLYLLEYLTDLTDPQRNVEVVIGNLGYSLEKTINYSGVGFIREYVRK